MEKQFALINDLGIVENIIVGRIDSRPCIPIANTVCEIGYRYIDGKFVPPEPPPEAAPIAPDAAAALRKENELLAAQVKALTDRGDFMEDCIAEMAMLLYE